MFRLIESSAGQLLKHVQGTSSKTRRFWDPKILQNYRTSSVSTFCYFCKFFGIPKMCTFTWCTLNMVQWLAWWWLY